MISKQDEQDQQRKKELEPVRFQIVLSRESVDRLDHLKETMDLTSRADVLRTALRLLDTTMDEQQKGKQLWIKDKDDETQQYRIFLT